MLSLRNASASATAGRRCAALAPAPRRPAACRSAWSALYELAKAGDVDAPPEVLIGGAIVVTLVSTALIPLVLKPGARGRCGEREPGDAGCRRRMECRARSSGGPPPADRRRHITLPATCIAARRPSPMGPPHADVTN